MQATKFRVLKPDGRQHGDRCYTCFVDLAVYSRQGHTHAASQTLAVSQGADLRRHIIAWTRPLMCISQSVARCMLLR